jgi:hypothetical protein
VEVTTDLVGLPPTVETLHLERCQGFDPAAVLELPGLRRLYTTYVPPDVKDRLGARGVVVSR